MERGYDEIVFYDADTPEGATIYRRVPMKSAFEDVLRNGPEPGTFYETTYGKTTVTFNHKPELPGLVRITISDQPFAYEDLVEFMTFFVLLSGWLGKGVNPAPSPCTDPSD